MRLAFSTIIVNAILFIAAAIAAYLFISTTMNSLYNIQSSMVAREKIISERLQTIIDIDSCYFNNLTSVVTLYVTNRGTISLNQTLTKLFINGNLTNYNLTLYDNNLNGIWDSYETIALNFSLGTGNYYVKVVASNGAYSEKIMYISSSSCTLA